MVVNQENGSMIRGELGSILFYLSSGLAQSRGSECNPASFGAAQGGEGNPWQALQFE